MTFEEFSSMSDAELNVFYAALEENLAEAQSIFNEDQCDENFERLLDAQLQLRDARWFWRSIGEYFGTRSGIKVD